MDIIDLGLGYPDDSLLPLAELKQAALHRLSQPDTSLLQYAPEEGSESFRRALAAFLTRSYGMPVALEHLLVAGGASHGLDLIL
jgi:2-aminoadipate transaminase